MTQADVLAFRAELWEQYRLHGRPELPWRVAEAGGGFDPYKIMVSEFMLQQTQVGRVIPKYRAFLEKFPTAEILAAASLGDVLRAWQGLGYNRRAKFLWQAAQHIVALGYFPDNVAELTKLSGIGPNTAGAIVAYAFNKPAVFIETNIRTVYLSHFFAHKSGIADKAIIEYVEATLDKSSPRKFYWALMDYGTHLKITGNLNMASKHYVKQSKFEGSRRQIRGQVIRTLADGQATSQELARQIADERLATVLTELVAEQLIAKAGQYFKLA